MPQAQKIVVVELIDGSTSRAIATGNNAAWICVCGRRDPLIGRTGALKGVSPGTSVDCPKCSRKYFVVPKEKDQGPVSKVVEVR
jgi:hypothetical protein